MKPNPNHFGEENFLRANRRAARLEDIEAHGRPTVFRTAKHTSMKQYNRQQERRAMREAMNL